MFSVKRMSMEDLAFAVRLTDTMRWDLAEDDFKFMMNLQQDGCFVLLDGLKKIGIISNTTFGQLGWIGSLIVSEGHRGKGAGTWLLNHSVEYQTSKGVESIGLYSYINTVPFYEKQGFKYDSEFVGLKGEGLPEQTSTCINEASKDDLDKIVEFDSLYFGASRRKLLESILSSTGNLCYLSIEDEKVSGYVMAKVYEQAADVGPLVCPQGRTDVAISLLKGILNKLKGFNIYTCLSQNETALKRILADSGFRESYRVARMFYGRRTVGNCIYVAESLERG